MTDPKLTRVLLPGTSWINTSDGPRQVVDLVDTKFYHRGRGRTPIPLQGFKAMGSTAGVLVKTQSGIDIELASAQHLLCEISRKQKFGGKGHNYDREWLSATQLQLSTKLTLERISRPAGPPKSCESAVGWLLGQMVGDGGYNPDRYAGYVRFWGEHAETQSRKAATTVFKYLNPDRRFKGARYNFCNLTWEVQTKSLNRVAHGLIEPRTKSPFPALERQSNDFLRGYIRGIFDADGSVQGSLQKGLSVRLTQNDLSKLTSIHRMLLRLGIDSSVYRNRGKDTSSLLPDGKGGLKEYKTKACHELVVANSSIVTFRRIIGLSQPDKSEKLAKTMENRKREYNASKFTATVTELNPIKSIEVFECFLDSSEVISVNGLVFGSPNSKPIDWLP